MVATAEQLAATATDKKLAIESYDPYDMSSCPSPTNANNNTPANHDDDLKSTASSTFLVSDILTAATVDGHEDHTHPHSHAHHLPHKTVAEEDHHQVIDHEVDKVLMSSTSIISPTVSNSFAVNSMAAVPAPPPPHPAVAGPHGTGSTSSYAMHSAMSQFNPGSFSSQYCQSDLGYHDMRGSAAAAAWYSSASDPRLAASEYCKIKSFDR